MNRSIGLAVILGFVLALTGCATKKETKMSAESSVIKATRDVVGATGNVMRNVVEDINDAVYGAKK